MKHASRTHLVLLFLLLLVIVQTRPVSAMPERSSCYREYEQFTARSWNVYDSCVWESYQQDWMTRLGTRQLCRLEWLSNAFQAEGDYASCMTGFSKLLQ